MPRLSHRGRRHPEGLGHPHPKLGDPSADGSNLGHPGQRNRLVVIEPLAFLNAHPILVEAGVGNHLVSSLSNFTRCPELLRDVLPGPL